MDEIAIVDNRVPVAKTAGSTLLLTSLDSFWSLLKPLLDTLQPARLCEIGIGDGAFCERLVEYCTQKSAHYTGIDPTVSDAFVTAHQSSCATFVRTPSLAALPDLDKQDIYFIDGDHNYYSVLNELHLSAGASGCHAPLIVLHDVCWPWARRDQYCAPDAIPEAYRHEYATDGGAMPGCSTLQEDGFKGAESDYHYAAATHEGGARNGVLTAVEDFIESSGNAEWKLIGIPVIFGMGILYHPEGMVPEVIRLLDGLASALCPLNDILKIMEANRLDLFLKFNKNLKHIKDLSGEYQALLAQYKKLAKHAADLLKAWHGLKAYADSLEAEIARLKGENAD